MRRLDLRRAWRAGTGAALLVAGLAACGGGSSNVGTEPNGDVGPIAGDYALAIIDGATVPVTIQFDHCDDMRFRAGGMTLGEDGTWQLVLKLFDADGNEVDARTTADSPGRTTGCRSSRTCTATSSKAPSRRRWCICTTTGAAKATRTWTSPSLLDPARYQSVAR